MTSHIKSIVCLIAMLCAEAGLAQSAPVLNDASIQYSNSSSPVAYVYVSDGSGNINAFAAASNGKLVPVTGSPFAGNVGSLAVNGKYLFGVSGDKYIYSFSIAPDGAVKKVASIDAQSYNQGDQGGPTVVFVDHTGKNLYDEDYDAANDNNGYQSFGINQSSGKLSYLGVTSEQSYWFYGPLSFIASNRYAYQAVCLYDMYWTIYGFDRYSNGMLGNFATMNASMPPPKPKAGDFFCPYLFTTDQTDHAAMSVQAINGTTFQPDGPPQLATYTANNAGDLITNSTYLNMPDTAVQTVSDIAMSPSGKLLAVGGTAGLQVFHFNGAKPITHYTGLLTKDEIDQFFWDNENHLYAISSKSGKLFVFTITPTSASQAPGSPYTLSDPQSIIVLPKT